MYLFPEISTLNMFDLKSLTPHFIFLVLSSPRPYFSSVTRFQVKIFLLPGIDLKFHTTYK